MDSSPVFDDAFRAQLDLLFRWRRDVRSFLPTPLPAELIPKLISTACLAPSVGYSQPWRFVRVNNPSRRAAIIENFRDCNREALEAQEPSNASLYARLKLAGLAEAPEHLAIFADPATERGKGLGRRTMPEMIEYSVVTAVHTLWLAARAQGLGVGWVSILDPAAVARTLDVPAEWRLIAYLCIGYPAEANVTPELARQGWEEKLDTDLVVWQR